jgi:hypothetical protein
MLTSIDLFLLGPKSGGKTFFMKKMQVKTQKAGHMFFKLGWFNQDSLARACGIHNKRSF